MSQFEDEMRGFMRESLKYQGKVEEHMENQTRWTASVSKKVDTVEADLGKKVETVAVALQSHKDETAPHGASASHRTLGLVFSIIGAACGIGGLLMVLSR